MTNAFVFDSYAIIEILKQNPAYAPYTRAGLIATKLHIFEVYHAILRDYGRFRADQFLEDYYPAITDYDADVIRAAAHLKLVHRKRRLSMADCVGYTLAQQNGILFLTGDKEFSDFPNVVFVKK